MYCLFILLVFSGIYCSNPQSEGEKLAKSYCGSCHLFTPPSMLDKTTWEKNVLPAMGKMMGISHKMGQYYMSSSGGGMSNDSVKTPLIGFNEWLQIVDYYAGNSPEKPVPQNRPPIEHFADLFLAKEPDTQSGPGATYIQIDKGNRRIYYANIFDSSFVVFDSALNILSRQNIHGITVDMDFREDLSNAGERNGVLTNIGILHPNDKKTGSSELFQINEKGSLKLLSSIAEKLPRPVQTKIVDLNKDGKTDYLVCGFGYNTGSFIYLQGKDSNYFEQKNLKQIPGAIKAYVEDYNNDGLQDIIVLFAQAQEGIYLYQNNGNGSFTIKELLRFSPVFGSSYFEMVDINKDGLKDIVYTCGDNSDYSRIFKNYHGVYIFLNKGNYRYEQSYFFPIHGCYKAIMKDFDKDGDLDIVSISFFPDAVNQPKEAFVYLENKGDFKFNPYTIREFDSGNWLIMDSGDIDGDGDEDVVIGSLILDSNAQEKNKKKKPPFLLLLNQTQ